MLAELGQDPQWKRVPLARCCRHPALSQFPFLRSSSPSALPDPLPAFRFASHQMLYLQLLLLLKNVPWLPRAYRIRVNIICMKLKALCIVIAHKPTRTAPPCCMHWRNIPAQTSLLPVPLVLCPHLDALLSSLLQSSPPFWLPSSRGTGTSADSLPLLVVHYSLFFLLTLTLYVFNRHITIICIFCTEPALPQCRPAVACVGNNLHLLQITRSQSTFQIIDISPLYPMFTTI